MTVYVDDMEAAVTFGPRKMIMCHMIADTDQELHAMADLIGVARRWHQAPPRASHSHYDIGRGKRAAACRLGAVRITHRQAAMMCANRRELGRTGPGSLGSPETAEVEFKARRAPAAAGVPEPVT